MVRGGEGWREGPGCEGVRGVGCEGWREGPGCDGARGREGLGCECGV